MLRPVGFFEELRRGWPPTQGRVIDAVRSEGEPDEASIIDYLHAGNRLLAVPDVAADAVTGDREVLNGASLYGDGTWVWRGDLPYYLKRYHVLLPDEFVDWIRAHDYRPDALSPERLGPVVREAVARFFTGEPFDDEKE